MTDRFSLNGANFVVDLSPGPNRRPSDSEAFTLVKSEEALSIYRHLARSHKPRTLLELGIFQGGSYVLLDRLFQPRAMTAVELSKTPIAPLADYIAQGKNRYAHFGTSQDDADFLRAIVRDDLGGILDMVVDDASHAYEQTRASFTSLFPLLSPKGFYVIEDWAWAHEASYQDVNAPWAHRHALTNLIFDLTLLQGSTRFIEEIVLVKSMAIVRKGTLPVTEGFWDEIKTRERDRALI